MKDRIYLYPGLGEGERHYLAALGTRNDIEEQCLQLTEGLLVGFHDLDATGNRELDNLLFEGTVRFEAERGEWYAMIDWGSFRHEPDEAAEQPVVK